MACTQRRLPGGLGDGTPRRDFGLLGVAGYYWVLTDWLGSSPESAVDDLIGLAFGGSLISVFARLGGGIYEEGGRRRRRPGGEDRGGHRRTIRTVPR